ncbi:hypothetical protein GCM10023187_02190 [Nibrella viscosa]|uniref:Type VI secretion system needle protein Hcp n=1 Tax=Nibrella viscosa TaxID=1084524 RepID=A0ABP8JSB4_9BACT
MASFRVEIEVDNDLFIVNRVFFTASRKRDARGQPASDISWRIYLAMDVLEQATFAEWMFSPGMKKDVKMKFYKTESAEGGESTLKEWNLKDVHCYGLVELFIADASFQTSNFFFSGKSVSNGNATIDHEPEE